MARRAARFDEVAGKSQEKGIRPMLAGGRVAGSKAWNSLRPRAARAWLRQYLLWRTHHRSQLLPAHHDADRDGMPRRRHHKRRISLLKWCRHTIAIVAVLSVMEVGCKRETQAKPEAVFSEVEKKFIAGDLPHAREQAQEAYQRFEGGRPDWAAVFRIELGKVLIYQGKSSDALQVLQQPLPAQSDLESRARRNIFLSIAEARLGHPDKAEQALLEAERECPRGPLRAEIDSTRGSIDLDREHLDDAEKEFQASLAGARRSDDRYLQTRALMNLGVVALQAEHYEDALVHFGDASTLARSLGAKLVLERAIGNLGWVYYRTGDFQRSLINSKAAVRQASELGSVRDQVIWLHSAGLSEYRLGDLDAARSSYEQSLRLAQSIQNQGEIEDTHVYLGFLLLRLNNPDAAEVHIREANRIVGARRYDRTGLRLILLEALLRDKRGEKQTAIKMLLNLQEHAAAAPSVQWETESTLAHLYLETGKPEDAGRWFQRSIETFRRQRSSLKNVESTLPFLENANDIYADYTEFLVHQHRPDEALNVVDASRAEGLADVLGRSAANRT